MPKWWIEFDQRLSFGLQSLGRNFSTIGGVFFRLGMVFLFYWYLREFVRVLWANQFFAWTLLIASIILAGAFLVIFVTAVLRFNPSQEPPAKSIAPFIWLNLLPIAVVALAGLLGADFTTSRGNFTPPPLLKFTQETLNRIWQYLF